MFFLLIHSFFETLLMVLGSTLVGLFLGVPLAFVLFLTGRGRIWEARRIHQVLDFFVNVVRSVPYVILVVLLIPFTRFAVGTAIGTIAALVPLSIAAALLIVRVVEETLQALPSGLVEVGTSIGAPHRRIIMHILFSEALPDIVQRVTTVVINIIGFSAMAGMVGGGGLGDLANRYGYQRYDLVLLTEIVLILIALVQLIQWGGNAWSRSLRKEGNEE